jgi:ectoine hydroxylase-related dioxygenase (phytanoyl-CoA dioxygenase family)
MALTLDEASRLRTLWTDAPDATDQLERMASEGLIRGATIDALLHFIEHGWLVMPGAIEPELIDRLVNDIRTMHRKPGKFVRTDHRNGGASLQVNGTTPDRFESLLDLYVNLESSRRVCMHPRISQFLIAVFRARPLAFQQLLFQRSNGHLFHQDTAYVAVEEPLYLAATWIALEDVVEGSGELAYYDASHKLPHILFKGGTKRFDFAVDDQHEYAEQLDTMCRERDLPYRRFMAKKGDVFFWAADLVHRSHPRTLPEDTSRLSCVTHYCPATVQPFWFNFHPDNRGIEPDAMGSGAFVSSFYKLPNEGRMIAPNRLG